MASFVPPKKNAAYTFYISLQSQSSPNIFQANPTLASGDVQVAVDDGAPANLGTLPVVDADFTKRVKVELTAAEMNGDNITVIFSDAIGAEWADLTVNIQTVTTSQIDDLATAAGITALNDLSAAQVNAEVDTAISDAALATAAALATVDGNVDSILADTGTDGVVVAAASKTGYSLSAAGVQAIWDALTSALTTVGSIGKLLVDNVNAAISSRSSHNVADVRTEMDSNSTQLAAIVADTNELQTDDVPGLIAALNNADAATIADAIWDEAKAGHVAAGSFGEEMQTHALSSEISALNDLSAAQVNAEVDTAINEAALATAAALATVDGNVDSIVTAVVGAISEITGASDIPATPTVKQAIALLYMALRNNSQSTSSERRILNDAGTEVLDAIMSDDGTTFSQGRLGNA